MPRMDWRAVATGAALALAVVVVTMVLVEVVDAAVGIPTGSNWVFLFYLLALAGLAAGGRFAAQRRPDAPLAHGLLAALGAYAVLAAFGLALRFTVEKGPDPVALAFNGLMAASAGILGTLLAERRAGSRR